MMTQRLTHGTLAVVLLLALLLPACASQTGFRERLLASTSRMHYVLLNGAHDQGQGMTATYPIAPLDARALTLEILRIRQGIAVTCYNTRETMVQGQPGLDTDQAIIAAAGSPIFALFDSNPTTALGAYVYDRGDRQSEVVAIAHTKAFFGYKEYSLAETQFHEAFAAAVKTRIAAGLSSSPTPPSALPTTQKAP